ncbi:Threonylcarbamoyl-AMP synthase [Paramyrothecium foliicola]|nr:Threonylcarbamoyl-AMP synthase [Paramyrothecium foliicola]
MSALPNGVLHRLDNDNAVVATPTYGLQDATSETELRAALAALHSHESTIMSRLDALIASQADLSRDLGRLDFLRAGLGAQVIATRNVGNDMLSTAAETAGRLSDKVKELDLEKSRVEDTLGVVEQVAELKACVHGVVGSMGAPQDWEAAAAYLARASKIPEEIIKGSFAASIVPTVEVPDAPWVTLENARESLCGLFLREFEKAAGEGDGAKVTRFFKLFPLIGRTDVGLDIYGKYVCQGVAGTARATLKDGIGGQTRKDGFFYANALTKLFEHIAQIVDSHGGLVERHYGSGKMVRVIERLQMEADVQGGIILDTWSDERGIDRRLTDVKSYPFSFLVQSFLPQPPRGGTPRVNSPAVGGPAGRDSEDEGVNMKEVDGLLREIAVMLGRWSLYTRFLSTKCKDPETPGDSPLSIPELLVKSNLYRKVAAKLTTPFNVMSTFFFRRSVEKAFQMDEYPSGLSLSLSRPLDGNAPYIILAVDDVMYMVNTVIQRSISASQRDVAVSVIPTIGRVLESDFVGMIQRKMRDEAYPKPIIQGGFPPEDKIIQFIVLINSLDMANEYLTRIISSLVGGSDEQANGAPNDEVLKASFPFERDVALVADALRTSESKFVVKTTELLNEGVQVLFHQVVKARLRPVLSDTFRDADYTLTEEELAEIAEQNEEDEEEFLDQVPRRFEHGWDQLMKPIGRLMTPGTFSNLLNNTARYLSKILEKRILGYSGRMTALGGIRMERDFTGIVNVVSRGDYGIREVFSRVTQLLMVANMEDDEWTELMADSDEGGIEWPSPGFLSLGSHTGHINLPAYCRLLRTSALDSATSRLISRRQAVPTLASQAAHLTMETRIVKVPYKDPLGQFKSSSDVSRLEEWQVASEPKEAIAALAHAAEYLRSSDIPVAFPTETVYGLGADATRTGSVKGIYSAKGRPSDNPLIVHVSDLQMLQNLLGEQELPNIYKPLIERFWPGPLTILLPNPQPSRLAPEVTAGLQTFGARMPSSSLALSLIKLAGVPLAAPSANASTKPSPTMAQHVKDDLEGRIELILDGGICQVGVESTVVDGLCDPPVVLRPGGVGMDELRACPGWENAVKAYKDKSEEGKAAPRAPGMKYKHYSPKARVVLYEATYQNGSEGVTQADIEAAQAVINGTSTTAAAGESQKRIGLIRTQRWKPTAGFDSGEFQPQVSSANGTEPGQGDHSGESFEIVSRKLLDENSRDIGELLDIDLGKDTRGIAQGLFSALRALDRRGADIIFVDGIDDEIDIAAAVMNRLRKAASDIRA